jgi:hypothetical protein
MKPKILSIGNVLFLQYVAIDSSRYIIPVSTLTLTWLNDESSDQYLIDGRAVSQETFDATRQLFNIPT